MPRKQWLLVHTSLPALGGHVNYKEGLAIVESRDNLPFVMRMELDEEAGVPRAGALSTWKGGQGQAGRSETFCQDSTARA
jgi:hypothetical protein